MQRNLNVFYVLIAVIIVIGVGFLGVQVSQLNDLYYSQQKNKLGTALDDGQLTEKIAGLEQLLNEQGKLIEKLSLGVSGMQGEIALQSDGRFLPAPEYGLDSSYIRVEGQEENKIVVVASRVRLTKWTERNELYWDYLLKKSLPLEYDRVLRRTTVAQVLPDSVFYRMGLRAGDRILSINGQVVNQGTELRNRLVELKDKEIILLRENKRLTISVNYKDALKKEVSLDLNKTEFNERLAQLTAILSPVATDVNGLLSGVRLVGQVNGEENVFTQMEFKPTDIITKINGTPVTGERFFADLETTGESFNIDYVRGHDSDQVTVSLKK